MMVLIGLGAVAGSPGCGDDAMVSPPTPPEAIPQEELCAKLAVAACAAGARCTCAGTDNADTCATRFVEIACPLAATAPLSGLVRDGMVQYDPAGAGQFVEAVRNQPCAVADTWPPATVAEATASGMLDGTTAAGEACGAAPLLLVDTCSHGYCAPTGRCVGLAIAGERCDDDHRCEVPWVCVSGTCGSPAASEQPCSDGPSCASGRCAGGRCADKLADGNPCTDDVDCESRRCAGDRCEPQGTDGIACSAHNHCQSGFCDAGTGRCSAKDGDGELCSSHPQCASGACQRDQGPRVAGACGAPRSSGEMCDDGPSCESGICFDGRCAETACDRLPSL